MLNWRIVTLIGARLKASVYFLSMKRKFKRTLTRIVTYSSFVNEYKGNIFIKNDNGNNNLITLEKEDITNITRDVTIFLF